MEQTLNYLNPSAGLSSSEASPQPPADIGTNTPLATTQDLAVMEVIVDEVYVPTPSSKPPLPSPPDRAPSGPGPKNTSTPEGSAGVASPPPEPTPRAWSPSTLMPTAPTPGAPFFMDYRDSWATSPASSDTTSTCTPTAPGDTPPIVPWMETDTCMSGPNSPESEERSSPDAPRWEDTQIRDVRYLLAQAHALCSQRQPIPFELDLQAFSNHMGDLALEITAGHARDFNPKRLGFSNYVQRDNIFPENDSMDIASPDAVNATFKITCAALSMGFGVPGQGGEGMHVLYPTTWFRAATLVISTTLQGLLSSEDIVHQGLTPVAPCLDDFEVDPSINYPNTKLQLLSKLTEQLHGEIGWAAQMVDGVDISTIWAKNKTDVLECLRGEARARVAQAVACWEAHLLADLQDWSVNEALMLMITRLEDEDGTEQCRAHAHTAKELMAIGADQQAEWRAQEMARQCTAIEDEVYTELALWKASKLVQEKRAHINAALAATSEEAWAPPPKTRNRKGDCQG